MPPISLCLQVGDGTTTVTMLAAEFLKQVKSYVDENVHPQVIVRSYRKATQLALDKIREIAVKIESDNPEWVLPEAQHLIPRYP